MMNHQANLGLGLHANWGRVVNPSTLARGRLTPSRYMLEALGQQRTTWPFTETLQQWSMTTSHYLSISQGWAQVPVFDAFGKMN